MPLCGLKGRDNTAINKKEDNPDENGRGWVMKQ